MLEAAHPTIRVQAQDFDLAAEVRALTKGRSDTGAVATFTGLCRSEGETLAALELEHYPGMAEKQLAAIGGQAIERWSLDGLTIVHRYGKITPGEQIVLVVATSSHRDAAFDAARFVMDFLKTDAPFWKKEHLNDGGAGDWVEAKRTDENARKGWE